MAGRRDDIARSPADVLRLVLSGTLLVFMLVVGWLFEAPVISFLDQLFTGFSALPSVLLQAITIVTTIAVPLVNLGCLAWWLARRRFRLLGTAMLAGGVGAALTQLGSSTIDETGRKLVELPDGARPIIDIIPPAASDIAFLAAAATAAAPWLPRNARRVAWAMLLGLTLVRFFDTPLSLDTVFALLVGWFAGSLVLVAFGGPNRRAKAHEVMAALTGVGVPLAGLAPADVDARGSVPYFGTTTDGMPVFVKVLGRDERSADLLFRIYRGIVPRHLGDERPFASLRRAVEHEALVAFAAKDLAVRTPPLLALAKAESDSFVLAYEQIAGRSLDKVGAAEITDEVLDAIWEQVVLLRSRRIAHRDLRLANIFLADDGTVWLIDFGFSELAASDLLLDTDMAELLASTSLAVGAVRAVARGHAAIGDDLARAVARLHPFALSGASRKALKARPALLEELRGLLEHATWAIPSAGTHP